MSTIEGGMVCINDSRFYEILRCLRSHGMLRESTDDAFKEHVLAQNPEIEQGFLYFLRHHITSVAQN